MTRAIRKLTIGGYKSIRKLEDFELRHLNVLIGANGGGKSNFVGFFRLLHEMIEQRLQIAIATIEGGADACLYLGPKVTSHLSGAVFFGNKGYRFSLLPTPDNRFVFAEESALHADGTPEDSVGSGGTESRLASPEYRRRGFLQAISGWIVYHFHDTSLLAGVRRQVAINDNEKLRHDAANLAPFLYRIQRTDSANYARIRDVVRLAAPFFDDFALRPIPRSPDMIQLEWRQRDSDYPFRANQLSDGTLRFICLATALLQPSKPDTVLFDEPELGLHPYALTLIANLFRQAAHRGDTQVIISTQSPSLLSEFAPEDVIVVERSDGESTFSRLDYSKLGEWLDEYTLGELWQKNVIGGRPRQDRIHAPAPNRGDHNS